MSEYNLDGLIAKVKSEAIESAEQEAKQIIDEAKAKAAQMLKNAEAKKTEMLHKAQAESKALVTKGKAALNQAARDVHITVKNDLLQLFKSVFESEVEQSFSSDLYTDIIVKVIDSLGTNLEIALPGDKEDQLVASLQQKVATSNNTINIIKKEQVLSGLSITKTDEGWSYNITAEEIAELFSQHLNPKWIALLNNK